MKTLSNWKVKGNKILVAEGVYLVEGETGKPSLVGNLSVEEIAFCNEKYIQNRSFTELKTLVKENSNRDKSFAKAEKQLKEAKKEGAISALEYAIKIKELKEEIYK